MKYKVGDKVRVKRDLAINEKYDAVVLSKIKGNGIEIYDDYDEDISKEVNDKLRKLKIM